MDKAMNISVEEISMLLGQKDMEIYILQKQLAEKLKEISELKNLGNTNGS